MKKIKSLISFIKYQDAGKTIVILLGLLCVNINNYCQENILVYEQKDSCFCENFFEAYSIYFNSPTVSSRTSFVSGYNESKNDVIDRVLNNFKSNVLKDNACYFIIATIVVDREGYVRCLKIDRGENDTNAKELLKIFQEEKFKPATDSSGKTNYDYFSILVNTFPKENINSTDSQSSVRRKFFLRRTKNKAPAFQ